MFSKISTEVNAKIFIHDASVQAVHTVICFFNSIH